MNTEVDLAPVGVRLLNAFLDRRSAHTSRAYAADLRACAAALNMSDVDLCGFLAQTSQVNCNQAIFACKRIMVRDGKRASTVNRHLAAVSSLLKMGRLFGLTSNTCEVKRERVVSYRDTRGPNAEKIAATVATIEARGDMKSTRDLAMIRLLFNQGLRAGEVVGVDLEHYDRTESRLSILGKGRTDRQWVQLSPKAVQALERWLALRGDAPGPIFGSMQARSLGLRLDRQDVWRMLRPYGIKPHGLRHSAITQALEATGGDLRAVQRFSRHMNIATLQIYDDARREGSGKVAALLDDIA